LEAIFASSYQYDESISRKTSTRATTYQTFDVVNLKIQNWGVKFQGLFKRKLVGFKLETGIRPGMYYRFSGSEKNTPIDRSYLMFGMGFGWM
jgi:hypothetical protein